MRIYILTFFFLLLSVCLNAQPVNSYSFDNTTGSYSSLSSETVLWQGTFDNEVTSITIPSFKISDNNYTSLTVSSNGFVTFGATAPATTYYTPISGSTAYDAAVSGMGVRLCNAASGTPKVSYNTNVSGEIVIQWQDVRRYSVANDVSLNFQIRLNPSTNEMKVVYGSCSTTYTSTSYSVQVGLRGNNYNVYNNRSTTSDWASTTSGTSRSATCRLNSTVLPAEGLTFTWTPPAACIAPTQQPTLLVLSPYSTSRTDGSFTAAPGSDSYLVVRTTGETLSENPVDGTTYSAGNALGNGFVVQSDVLTSFSATGLTNAVEYFFHVFSMNSQCTGGPLYLTSSPLTGSAYTIPNTPTSIAATGISTSEIELTPVCSSDVMIAWNTSNAFGVPSGSYTAGDEVTGGGTVFYVGDPSLVPDHSGLSSGTTYYYRCWAVAGTSYSTSYREANATTVTVLPYSEGFESSTSSSVPVPGWQQDGTGSSWTVYNYGTIRTGTWRAALVNTANKWMFRSLNLTGGQLYYIRFYALGSSADPAVTSVSIAYGSSATAAAMTEIIVDESALNNSVYGLVEGFFMPATSGIYYLGINGFVSSFSNSISIDDIMIEEADDCPPPTMVTATNVSSSGADITWSQFGSASQWNLKYGTPGFDPETEGLAINNISTLTQAITGLNPLTQYEVRLQAVCDDTPGSWSQPCIFTTTVDPLSGIYTIDQGQPASSTNFISFNHLKSFLEAGGLGGAVVVNVVAESGPYSEQVILNEVTGASQTNTITINGNSNSLEYLSTTNDQRATLKLDGAKWMVFSELNISALGSQTGEYGYAVQLMNNADNNSFIGCEISANESSTSTNFSGFVSSNSHTNNTSAGETATNLTVDQCTISGGYYAVSLNGPTDTGIDLNLVFTNNAVSDFYYRGINLSHQRNALISGNHICFTGTRTASSSPNMIYISQNSSDTKITGNRINNFAGSHSTNQTISVYGVYGTSLSAATDRKLLIANNLIYGFDKISGTHYGMYLSGTNIRVFHNTISLDFADYPGLGQQYGIYHTGSSANLEVVNNIVSIESNATNIKYGLLYSTTGSVQNSNNNVIYMNTPNGSSNYTGRYVSSNYAGMEDWQTTGFDANSLDEDPFFVSENSLVPQNLAIDNIGANLLSIVPVDFDGNARSETPDPGAFEFQAECMPPISPGSSQVYNTAGTSVRINWTGQNGEANWEVEYGLSGFTQGEGTLIETDNDTTIITGLIPDTEYDFFVRAICSEGFESDWAGPGTFSLCPLSDVPLSYDFEDIEELALPDCWSEWPVESSRVGVTSATGYNSDQCIWVSGSSGTVFLISPEMQNPINSLYLNFRAKYSSSSGSLNIGTVYSPDDTESFSLIKSVPLTTEFEYYQIILDDYEGSDKYIAISSSQVNALIDDLTVDFIPVCVMPLNLDGDVIASTSASLTWDAGNDETQWELAYGSPGFDPDTEGTKIDDISATAYTITGLLPGSRVEAYVRSDCGVGDYSEWSLPFYFETLCDILNLPFNEGFIDPSEPLCWVDDNNYWDLASNSNNAGGIAPYEAYYQRRSLSGISRLVTPQINTSGKQEVILSFKSKMVDYTLGSYQATITVQTQHETASWWVTENWEMDVKTGSNEQLDVSLSIPTYGSDYLKIAFCIMGDHMALENWSIDDVSVAEVTSCFTPLNVVAGNATAESIDLSWTQPGDESSWDIEYGPVGFAQGEGTLIEAVGVNPYSLTGLESSSTYEVYVRAGCGEGQYSFWSESTVFQTICDQVYDLPFAEAFDETEMPVCWREQLDDPSQSGDFESWIVEAYDDAGGTPNQLALYACAYNGISRLIMPQLNTAGISNVIFSFDTYIDDSEALPLDFKTQMSVDGENWTDIDGWGYNTENGIFGPQNVSVEITGLSSEVLFLAFVVDGDHENFYFWSIDNVEVESNLVPEDLEVISFNAECFNALNNISVAGNSNSVLIPDGESATFIAGQSIRFLPGFHAEAGSYVDAHITTDGIFCNSLAESSIVLLEPDEKSEELDAQEENYMSPFIDAFDVKIYPNPNNGRFTIEIYNSTDERASLFVYSLNGLMLYRSETGKSQDVNLPYLRAGLYMVRVESGGERIIKKMVVN